MLLPKNISKSLKSNARRRFTIKDALNISSEVYNPNCSVSLPTEDIKSAYSTAYSKIKNLL